MPAASSIRAAAIHGLGAQQLANAALFDDGVTVRTETRAEKNVLNVTQPARLAIDQIKAFTRPVQAALNDDVAWPGRIGPCAIPVAIAVARSIPVSVAISVPMAIGGWPSSVSVMVTSAIPMGRGCGAIEYDIFHLFAAERFGALFAQHPGDGVGDIALAATVRADNAVTPASLTAISALSEKDLKPMISMRRSFNTSEFPK